MGLSAEQLQAGLDALAQIEPGFASGLARAGYPAPRIRERGYETLLRTIVGQQVSVHAADAIWQRLEAAVGGPRGPARRAGGGGAGGGPGGVWREEAGYQGQNRRGSPACRTRRCARWACRGRKRLMRAVWPRK